MGLMRDIGSDNAFNLRNRIKNFPARIHACDAPDFIRGGLVNRLEQFPAPGRNLPDVFLNDKVLQHLDVMVKIFLNAVGGQPGMDHLLPIEIGHGFLFDVIVNLVKKEEKDDKSEDQEDQLFFV